MPYGSVTFEWAEAPPENLGALVELDERCLPGEAWDRRQWRAFFGQGLKLAAFKRQGRLAGYLALLPLAEGEAEVLKLGIAPELRRQGHGRRLMDFALERLGEVTLFLELRASNEAAFKMYSSFGFAQVGRRRHYYQAPLEDALILQRPT